MVLKSCRLVSNKNRNQTKVGRDKQSNKGKAKYSTVNLLIKIGCFVTKEKYSISM